MIIQRIRVSGNKSTASFYLIWIKGSSLKFADFGWAVVYEDSKGAPGWILGARRFGPGMYENEAVELLRGTTPGNVYYVIIHGDNGDKQFDLKADLPLTDESGVNIMQRFMTTGGE